MPAHRHGKPPRRGLTRTLAEIAIPHAQAAALASGAGIHLLQILDPADHTSPLLRHTIERIGNLQEPDRDATLDGWREAAEDYLTHVADQLRDAGVTEVTTRVVEGNPYAMITQEAVDQHCDFVVIATNGRSGLGRALVDQVELPEVRQAILDGLHAESIPMRQTAVEMLPWLPDAAELIAQLEPMLNDEHPNIRWTALQSLYWSGARPGAKELALALLEDDDMGVRSQALEALRWHLDDENIVTTIQQIALTDDSMDVRYNALLILSDLPGPADTDFLRDCLRDEDHGFRSLATDELGEALSSDPTVASDLIELLNDAAWWVRLSAAAALDDYVALLRADQVEGDGAG